MRRWRALVAGSALGAALVVAPASLAAAVPPSWTIDSVSAPYVSSDDAVSCVSATVCDTIGSAEGISVVSATVDGGATWSIVASLPPTVQLSALHCASARRCLALDATGPEVVATTDGWSTYAVHRAPSPLLTLQALSCDRAATCVVAGAGQDGWIYLAITSNLGATWTTRRVTPDSPYAVGEVYPVVASCPSARRCIVFGYRTVGSSLFPPTYPEVFVTDDGGARWATRSLPGGVDALTSLACPTTRRCYGTGVDGVNDAIVQTDDGGVTWRRTLDSRTLGYLGLVDCPSVSTCLAAGGTARRLVVVRTSDAGATWSVHGLGESGDEPTGFGLSCGTTATCTAVGPFAASLIDGSTDGGVTWRAEDVVTPPTIPERVVCPAAGTCELVGATWSDGAYRAYAARSTDAGASWTPQALPAVVVDTTDVTCPTVTDCAIAALDTSTHQPVVVTTADGGATWTVASVPLGLLEILAIDCPTATACAMVAFSTVANGAEVLTSSDFGASWTVADLPALPSGAVAAWSDVSCSSASDCTVVGQLQAADDFVEEGPAAFVTTTDGGASWTLATVSTPGASGTTDLVTSVACASSSECVAEGANYNEFTAFYTGVGYTTDAVAVMDTVDGGADWSEEFSVGAAITYASNPACEDGTCLMVGAAPSQDGAYALTSLDGGATWSAASMPAGWLVSWSLGCADAEDCVTLGFTTSGGVAIATYG